MEGLKYDQGKLRMDLIPPEFIEHLAGVLTFGTEKYTDDSWQAVPNATNRYYAALMRHLMSWRRGDIEDMESGCPHLAHAAFNVMALLWLDEHGEQNEPKSND